MQHNTVLSLDQLSFAMETIIIDDGLCLSSDK